MNTYALQLVMYYQDASSDDVRFDNFLHDMQALARRHGITHGEHQSCCFNSEDYKIGPCKQCGHLTVNAGDVRDGIDNMLPDFWFYVHRGRVSEGEAICDYCEHSANAT